MDRSTLRTRLLAIRQVPRPAVDVSGWLVAERWWVEATLVAGYHAVRGELPVTAPLRGALARGARVVLPRIAPPGLELHPWDGGALPAGSFGVPAPAVVGPATPPSAVEVYLVPGVGFDQRGNRLGHGKGHYDRLLAGVGGLRIGVGWADQVVDELPVEPWDVAMDGVLTERGWAWRGARLMG